MEATKNYFGLDKESAEAAGASEEGGAAKGKIPPRLPLPPGMRGPPPHMMRGPPRMGMPMRGHPYMMMRGPHPGNHTTLDHDKLHDRQDSHDCVVVISLFTTTSFMHDTMLEILVTCPCSSCRLHCTPIVAVGMGPPPPPGMMPMPPMMIRPPPGYSAPQPLHYPSQDPTRMGTAGGSGNPEAMAARSTAPDDAADEDDARPDSPLLPPGETESDYTRTEDM